MEKSKDTTEKEPEIKSKFLGSPIEEEYYWIFHGARTKRKESVKEALRNAICMYAEDLPKGDD